MSVLCRSALESGGQTRVMETPEAPSQRTSSATGQTQIITLALSSECAAGGVSQASRASEWSAAGQTSPGCTPGWTGTQPGSGTTSRHTMLERDSNMSFLKVIFCCKIQMRHILQQVFNPILRLHCNYQTRINSSSLSLYFVKFCGMQPLLLQQIIADES